jgi:hypothetical protein
MTRHLVIRHELFFARYPLLSVTFPRMSERYPSISLDSHPVVLDQGKRLSEMRFKFITKQAQDALRSQQPM